MLLHQEFSFNLNHAQTFHRYLVGCGWLRIVERKRCTGLTFLDTILICESDRSPTRVTLSA